MIADNWITLAEAAELLGDPDSDIERLVKMGAISGQKRDNEIFVDKEHLLGWIERRDAHRVQLTEAYVGIGRTMLEHFDTIYSKQQAQHSGTRGAFYEQLLQGFLRDHLPQRFHIGSGQVLSSAPASDVEGLRHELSRQTDIIIFDIFNHPVLLPGYELFPIEGTLAVIEVKSKLQKSSLIGERSGALPNIESTKRLISEEARIVRNEPRLVQVGNQMEDLRTMPSPLGIVFAFESNKPETIARHWRDWNASTEPRYRTDMICLLKEQVLIIDTNRFKHLWDTHQICTDDPLAICLSELAESPKRGRVEASARQNNQIPHLDRLFNSLGANRIQKSKLVALQTPTVLFFFVSLLLRELKRMSAFSQQLVDTTPCSYLRKANLCTLFCVDNT